MNRVTWTWCAIAAVSLTSVTRAEDRSAALRDLSVIQDGRGAARILFRIGELDLDDHTLIRRATLSVPVTTLPEERVLDLRLYPLSRSWDVTASWTAPWTTAGGDFDRELYSEARVDLRSGSSVAVFDVTSVLKEVLEEEVFADGFLLTDVTGGASGIRLTDVAALQLTTAALSVSTRTVINRPGVPASNP